MDTHVRVYYLHSTSLSYVYLYATLQVGSYVYLYATLHIGSYVYLYVTLQVGSYVYLYATLQVGSYVYLYATLQVGSYVYLYATLQVGSYVYLYATLQVGSYVYLYATLQVGSYVYLYATLQVGSYIYLYATLQVGFPPFYHGHYRTPGRSWNTLMVVYWTKLKINQSKLKELKECMYVKWVLIVLIDIQKHNVRSSAFSSLHVMLCMFNTVAETEYTTIVQCLYRGSQ